MCSWLTPSLRWRNGLKPSGERWGPRQEVKGSRDSSWRGDFLPPRGSAAVLLREDFKAGSINPGNRSGGVTVTCKALETHARARPRGVEPAANVKGSVKETAAKRERIFLGWFQLLL